MQNETLSQLSLLYVEDDATVRRNAVEYLSRLCKTVYEASDGKEAIRVWREHRPDIIITDISMPRLDGLDMAAYIRAHDQQVQIIVATAFTDTDYLMKAVELHLVKYLVKPVNATKLHAALAQSISQREDKSKFTVTLTENCHYNAYTQHIICDGRETKLTKNEGLFLNLLAHHHTRIVHYEEIEDAVWPDGTMTPDAIRSLVRALRRKLPDDVIENSSGIGYRLHAKTAQEPS